MSTRMLAVLLLVPVFALGGCAPNPADNVPAAQVDAGAEGAAQSPTPEMATTEAPTVVPAAAAAGTPPVGTFPLVGKLMFEASKVTATHLVEFKDWQGSFTSDGTLPGTSLEFTATMDSLVVDEANPGPMHDRLTTHLKSDDFFDVANYPNATFKSTAIVEGVDMAAFPDAAGATHTVTGDLTVKDKTKTVTFPVTVQADETGAITASAKFALNRQDFGIVYPGAPDDLIRDEFVIVVDASLDTTG